jgi:hypothetical protein
MFYTEVVEKIETIFIFSNPKIVPFIVNVENCCKGGETKGDGMQ